MGTSLIHVQRTILLRSIRETAGQDDWKVLVLDEESRRLLNNVATEDNILNERFTNVEQIEDKRPANSSTDAVYLLSPLPHIVECLRADLKRRRYRRSFLIWLSPLPGPLQEKLYNSPSAREQIAVSRSLDVDFYPRESHLVLFQEPWSFHNLFHPACSSLVPSHLEAITRRIVSICLSLGENPVVKYYRPKTPNHESSVLCSYLANYVQKALDSCERAEMFPTTSSRPQGVLIITDRTMDLVAPLVHEFTYQAMAMDLLPIRDDEGKFKYRNTIKKGTPEEEERDVEINDDDKIWVANRHLHMKDLLGKIVNDFNKFRADNPQFADVEDGKTSVNTLKDMIAGLPQFQAGKEAFSLHLEIAEKCVKIFQDHKLPEIASVEQTLATGLDDFYRKPKNLADQVVRLLDDDSVIHEDRLRLLIMYILFKNGILSGDIEKLRQHAQLSPMDGEIIFNFDLLGARVQKPLKDTAPTPPQLFPVKVPTGPQPDEVSLSRFEPALRGMLEEQCLGTLDSHIFPPMRPNLENTNGMAVAQTSLRTANKPTWAKPQKSSHEPRQRVIVFMAGGATYAEARACYEVSHTMSKEVYLVSSHMLTPKSFLRQVSLLSAGRKALEIPADKPAPRLPAWVTEKDAPPRLPQQTSTSQNATPVRSPDLSRSQQQAQQRPNQPPTDAMRNMNLNARPGNNGRTTSGNGTFSVLTSGTGDDTAGNKLKKDKKDKRHLGGLFKKH